MHSDNGPDRVQLSRADVSARPTESFEGSETIDEQHPGDNNAHGQPVSAPTTPTAPNGNSRVPAEAAPDAATRSQPWGEPVATDGDTAPGVGADRTPTQPVPVRLVAAQPYAGTHAVFVDVGYVYAAVGLLVVGSAERRAFRVDAETLISALIDEARQVFPQGRLLRVYWYDGARDRVHTVEQRQIAELPDVKVRLGNLNAHNQQKGVDSLIRSDLESLARNRAISDAVLISGDEDLVAAVEAAQSYGVRVHLWGVEPAYGTNQADPLVWEADQTRTLHQEFCAPCVTPALPPFSAPTATTSTPSTADGGATPRTPPREDEVWRLGQDIAQRWLVARGRENMADLLTGPKLPTTIDRGLLVDAESLLRCSLRPYEDLRRALRNGFWDRLTRELDTDQAT